jgi:amidase
VPGIHAFDDDALGASDTVSLRNRIERREVSTAEVVDAAIARAERVNPTLNAIASPCFESARRHAGEAQRRPYAGIPTFVKDTDPMKGAPHIFGSRGMPRSHAKKDSDLVADMRQLGFVMLGKSTTPEFGLTGTTEALVYGPTRNPWDTDASTGGSSGGAAALVASGVVPLAHANDGGGSIRIPASCCGLVGLKPSRGRLPDVEGAALLPVKIIQQGVLSRTVRDTASFYHEAERHRLAPGLRPIGLVEGPGRRIRIGYFLRWNEERTTAPECVDAVLRTAKLLEKNGHRVEEIDPPYDPAFADDFLSLWMTMAFAVQRLGRLVIHPRFDGSRVEPFTRALSNRFRERAPTVPFAIRRLHKFARRYEAVFDEIDVLLTPTLGTPPPRIGHLGPDVPFDVAIERLEEFLPFTASQNVSGTPAVSVPAGKSDDGLPIGVQLAAALGHERMLLELAFELEESAPWPLLG